MTEAFRIDAGGHGLRALHSGAGERHFLCLHGLVDTLAIWEALAPALEARGRVCRIDQRGHGDSDAPPGPYTREDLAGDVVAVLDALAVERAVLVGHSMGGVVAMATALAHPDRVAGLVLIGSTGQCGGKVAAWYERIARAGEERGARGLIEAIYGERSKKRLHGEAQGVSHVTRMLRSLHDDPLTPKLAALACPALLLVGEEDPMGPKASELLHAAFPPGRAELHRLAGHGHWLHVEAVDALVGALDAWLAKVEP
ncbi:MAG: alpha/beta hydrolase [Myxococcota bacterium]